MKNILYCGDNLDVLKKEIEEESVDLIYIDPPFFSNKQYEVVWGDEAEIRSFKDRWEGGINVYVDWMKQRVIEIYRVLKPTGSFYLHCDWHVSHYLKIMCDDIFDYRNFKNEVIWHKGFRGTEQESNYQHATESLMFYTKSSDYIWNQLYQSYKDTDLKRYNKVDENGKRYALIKRKRTNGTVYYGKTYPKKEGKRIDNIFNIPTLASTARERLGYPTQKPEALLEKIIKASSNKGDLVLDAFCGCGTTMAVAQKLNRKWVGIDISPTAIKLVERRLGKVGAIKDKNYKTVGLPTTEKELRKLEPFVHLSPVLDNLTISVKIVNLQKARITYKGINNLAIDYTKLALLFANLQ